MRRLGVFFVVVSLLLLALPVLAGSQTRISGTTQCTKSDPEHMIEVGDRPNHAFSIGRQKCTWIKSFEIGGTEAKEDISTFFSEISGDSARDQGFAVGTMANGDNYHVRWEGTTTFKDGVPQSTEGKWRYVGGTGRLKGLSGQGTYKGNGTTTFDIEGEYQLPN